MAGIVQGYVETVSYRRKTLVTLAERGRNGVLFLKYMVMMMNEQMNTGYISDTAMNRTHNLFRPKREPIPLGHSDGAVCPVP